MNTNAIAKPTNGTPGGRFTGLSHRLAGQIKLWVPPSLQRKLSPHISNLKEMVVPFVKPYLEVRELSGMGKGSPLKLTYVGHTYGLWYLKNVMFREEPLETRREPIHIRRLNAAINAVDSDILIVNASDRMIRKLPGKNALVAPVSVEQMLDIRGTWEDIRSRFRKSRDVSNEFRLMRRHAYSYEISHDDQDLQTYYQTMYSPTMDRRHGENAVRESLAEAQEYMQHGCLFLLKREGQTVAGSVCHYWGDILRSITVGYLNGDDQLMEEAVVSALNVSLMRWGNEEGFKVLDFQDCPPYPKVGIFQSKRKWGTAVGVEPGQRKRLWFNFRRDTPAVRQFLIDNPFITLDKKGDLSCQVFTASAEITAEEEERYHRLYYSPGLKDVIVRPVTDLIAEGAEPQAARSEI